ncbi:MAG: type VII secretion protein EsaA [Culicoidibacterales bacterium]
MKKIAVFMMKIGMIFAITVGVSFFAFEKIYESMRRPEMKIALVNEDSGTYYKAEKISFGSAFVKQAERDKGYQWTIGTRSVGESKLEDNEVDLLVIIPNDFSKKAVSFNEVNPEQLKLIYKINPRSNFLQLTQSETVLAELESGFNKSITEVYFASALQNIDNTKINVNRIVEEQKAHEKIVVEDVNANVAKMTENFTTVKIDSEQDTKSLEALAKSLESFNKRNIENKDFLGTYNGNHRKFEGIYQQNNVGFSGFMQKQGEFNNGFNNGRHQEKIGSIRDSIVGIENYFTGNHGGSNAVIRLEEAKLRVDDAVALLKDNRRAIDSWIVEDESGASKLDNDVKAIADLVSLVNKFPQDNNEVKMAIELKITEFCRDNLINTSLVARNAAHACYRLGYGDEGSFKSSFTGTSYFAIDAQDTTVISLSVDQKDSEFKHVSCATVEDFGHNFISKEQSSMEVIDCPPIINEGQEVRINVPQNADKQQLLAITYTIMSQDDAQNIEVNQELLTQIPRLMPPTINAPDSGQNSELSGTGVAGSTIIFEDLVDVDNVLVGADGKWQVVVSGLVQSQIITIHQELLMARYDGEDFINRSESVTTVVGDNLGPEISRIKVGKNSRIEGSGTPFGTVFVTFPEGLSLSTTVDQFGSWRLVSPIELFKNQRISAYQIHDINGGVKTSPIVDKVVVETINLTINHIEAAQKPIISGTGEPGALLKIYKKSLAITGEEVILEPVLAELRLGNVEDETIPINWSVDLAVDLAHGQKIVVMQTDLYGNEAGMVEQTVQDTIAPNMPRVTSIAENRISGMGDAGAKISLQINGQEQLPDLIREITVSDEGVWEFKTEYVPNQMDELNFVQTDQAGNSSGTIKIILGTEQYQDELVIGEEQFAVGQIGIIRGTARAGGEINVKINDVEKTTVAAENGNWAIDFTEVEVITLETVITIIQLKQTDELVTTTEIHYQPKIKGAPKNEILSVISENESPVYYTQSAKKRKLDNTNITKVETTPEVINQYFTLYYGHGIASINNEFSNRREIEANATETSLYKKLNSQYTSIEVISKTLSDFKDAIKTSFLAFKVQTQGAIDILDGPNCNPDGLCLGGVDDGIAIEIEGIKLQGEQLRQLKSSHEEFTQTFTSLQGRSTEVTNQLAQLSAEKAEEAPLLLAVTEEHKKMLEQGSSLQESAEGYHKTVEEMRNSADDFANITIEMTDKSTTYLQHLQKVTTKLQEDVEGNANFSDNLATVFANSKIDGAENDYLYDFMSNPVKKENFSEKAFRGITLFPYFTTIISFTLSLMLAYTFLNWKRKLEIVYADEYTWDVLMANVKKSGLLFAIATLVGIIVGMVSAFMAGLLSWQLLSWVIALVFIINAFTHLMYFCLRQFKSFGLFLILGVVLVYLLSSQAMGVYVLEGSVLAKILALFPLVYIEDMLSSILYGSSLAGHEWVIFSVVLVLVGAIVFSLLIGVYEAKKEVQKNA